MKRQHKVEATLQRLQTTKTIVMLQEREAQLWAEARNQNDRHHAVEQAVEQGAADDADWQDESLEVIEADDVYDDEDPDARQ